MYGVLWVVVCFLFFSLLQGLQRLVVLSADSKPTAAAYGVVSVAQRTQIERLAMDLLRADNEEFALPALELLLTCIYVGKLRGWVFSGMHSMNASERLRLKSAIVTV